ncbi:MAG: hypothetical protein ACODAG_04035 [Myxococcota bacterium]
MDEFPPVDELIPHARPMLLVDRVVAYAGDHIRCELHVQEGGPFVRDGRVGAIVAVEWLAQTAAAWVGLHTRGRADAARPGYLVHMRELALEAEHFEVGAHILVDVERTSGDPDLGSFAGAIRRADQAGPVVRATFSVYRGTPLESP